MNRFIVLIGLAFAIIALGFYSPDRLVFSSYELFTGTFAVLTAQNPFATAAALFAALALALILVFRLALEVSSERAAWSSMALIFASAPILLAPLSIGLGFLAAPLLILFVFQVSTRRYRLVSIALPIVLLFIIGFGHYVLLVLVALLLTSPLRPDPDPRLGELFLLVSIAFIASGSMLPTEFSVDRTIPFGLVLIALAVFATYRVISKGSRRADPIVSLALASAALFFLSDPLAPLMLTLSAGVLVAIAIESIFRFFELSRVPFKRAVAFGTVVVLVMLTLAQSVFFVAAQERMDPGLASSLASIDEGVVAIDHRLAHALAFYSGATVVALDADDLELFERSVFVIPVIERSEDRFSRVVLASTPPYAQSECFVVEPKGVLVEVRIVCSLS